MKNVFPDKLYYRIGEVSKITKTKPHVLRYWESEFKIFKPQKARSKHRLYKKKDIELIFEIKRLLYKERFTLEGAKKKLREFQLQPKEDTKQTDFDLSESDALSTLQLIEKELREIRSILK
jgi:DNA-binding transcriptional MerR regulator